MSDHYLKTHPDKNGYFGEYGGAMLPPPSLSRHFKEIREAYDRISKSADFPRTEIYPQAFSGPPDTDSLFKNLSDCAAARRSTPSAKT